MPTSRARAARAAAAYTNGNNSPAQSMSPAAAAAFASLQQQVVGIESDFSSAIARIENAVDNLNRKIDAQAANLAASSQTDWKSLAPWAMFLLVLGGALYWPINQTTNRLERDVAGLQSAIVPRVEHEREWRRLEQALADGRARVEKNQDALLPKDIWRQSSEALQRQLDDLAKNVGSVVTTRDVLQELSKKTDRLETEIRAMGRDPGQR